MTTNAAHETRMPEDQEDTAGFGAGIPGQPQREFIILLRTPAGLPVIGPQTLTCRKAGKDQQEF